MKSIIGFIKRIIPNGIKIKVKEVLRYYLILKVNRNHKVCINAIREKDKINVAFLVVNASIWKYDRLFLLMQADNRFLPKVFVCPFNTYGQNEMEREMERTFQYFTNKGYSTVNLMDDQGELLDIKNDFKPDLVFFCTPWHHTYPQYLIGNFLDTLTCYVNYGYTCANLYELQYNKDTEVYTWSFFIESEAHKTLATKYSIRNGKNTVITGFPGTDDFIDPDFVPKDIWKIQNKKKKRIIWAPHHSIEGVDKFLNYSTFLKYDELMIEMAQKYADSIQWTFKPHPDLRGKLYRIWGDKKTDEYYDQWKNMPNTQIEEGNYIDLFLTSDAMIHDSGSFLIEYLYTHKPVLYLINNDKSKLQYNFLGQEALKNIPLGYTKDDIIQFIEQTVLLGEDKYAAQREVLFHKYLLPPNNKLASENIFEYLVKELNL